MAASICLVGLVTDCFQSDISSLWDDYCFNFLYGARSTIQKVPQRLMQVFCGIGHFQMLSDPHIMGLARFLQVKQDLLPN